MTRCHAVAGRKHNVINYVTLKNTIFHSSGLLLNVGL